MPVPEEIAGFVKPPMARRSVGIFFLYLAFQGAACLSAGDYSHQSWRTEDGLPQDRVQALAQTSDGYLGIGTPEGLARFDGYRFFIFDSANTAATTDNSISSPEAAPDGSLWIGTEGGGLLHYRSGAFQTFGESNALTNGFIRATLPDRKSTLWVGTDRGFLRHSERHFARLVNTPELPLASIVAIAEDASGKVCPATLTDLLTVDSGRLRPLDCGRPLQFFGITAISLMRDALIPDGSVAPPAAIRNFPVTSTRRDTSGTLWIGTIGRGLIPVDPKSGATTGYLASSVLPENTVFLEFEDRQHNILAAGWGPVLPSQGKVRHFAREDGLRSDSTREIVEDSRGAVWFAASSGLSSWNGQSFSNYYLEPGLSYPGVRCLPETPAGDILAGTDAGLNRIRAGRILSGPSFSNVKREEIWSLYVDGSSIWPGTRGSELILFKNGRTFRFIVRDGLVSNSIYGVVDDRAGRFWLSSPAGVFSIRRSELDAFAAGNVREVHATAFGASDGMATTQMYADVQLAGVRRASGPLWFPSVRGAVRLHPAHLPVRRSGPSPIEDVSAADVSLSLPGEVAIPPGHERVQIDFTACNLVAPQQVTLEWA